MQEILWSIFTGAALILRDDDRNPFSHLSKVDTVMLTPSVATNLDPTVGIRAPIPEHWQLHYTDIQQLAHTDPWMFNEYSANTQWMDWL